MSFTPQQVNHGMWFSLHTLAKEAFDTPRVLGFTTLAPALCLAHPCLQCRSHFAHFLQEHPFGNYLARYYREGRDIGMFMWSVALHNHVNLITGKPHFFLEEAYQLYYRQPTVCTDCGEPSVTFASLSRN